MNRGKRALERGIGKVHRIPPVGLKCLSEMRRREKTARQLTGWGESKAVAAPAQNRTPALLPKKLSISPLHFLLDFWRQL